MTIATLFIIIGFAILVLDLMFLGVNFLMFAGVGAIATGAISSLGFIPEGEHSLYYHFALFAVLTALNMILLWKPMKRFQNNVAKQETTSDLVGLKLVTNSEVTHLSGTVRYSGLDWPVRLDSSVPEGTTLPSGKEVEVVAVSGNEMIVK
jgi:inner membrane protein